LTMDQVGLANPAALLYGERGVLRRNLAANR
jgi:hypothetical protein